MKKALITTVLAVACGVCTWADDSTGVVTNDPMAASESNMSGMAGRFGAGITLGEPIGPSLKYFFTDQLAIDSAFGWSLHDHSNFYLQGDLLWHNFQLIPVSQGKMPLYFGAGGLVRFRNSGEDDQFALRVPVGVSYYFDNAPVEVFAEVGPALDLTPSLRGEVTGGVGVRFWF